MILKNSILLPLTKRIIPCLVIDNGRVVKGTKFLDIQDAGDPVEVAKRYDMEGADEIAFLDITATHENRKTIIETVENVATEVFIPLTVGGGVSSFKDVITLLNAGADKVAINSAAVKNPDIINEVTDKTGSQCIVAAVDAKKESSERWAVYTHGGRKKTNLDALRWAKQGEKNGAGEILLTSMGSDGTKKGYNLKLTKLIAENVSIPVIASGGAGSPKDMVEVVLKAGASAVLAASIFHYGIHTIHSVKKHMFENGILVRDCD